MSVTEKSAVPTIAGKKAPSNAVLTAGLPVTEVSRLQRIAGDKLGGQEVSTEKVASTNRLQSLLTDCGLTQPSLTVAHTKLVTEPTGLVYRQRNNGEVTRLYLEHQDTGPACLPRD